MLEHPVQRTAAHESGHAVAALHLGVRFEAVEVRIDAIDGYWHCSGRLRGSDLPEIADNARLKTELIVIMAGYAAESLFAPSNGFSLTQFTDRDDRDFTAALDILLSMQPPVTSQSAREAAMAQAWHNAREIIVASWAKLTAVADELVRLTQPNGETVACHVVLTPKALSQLLPPGS